MRSDDAERRGFLKTAGRCAARLRRGNARWTSSGGFGAQEDETCRHLGQVLGSCLRRAQRLARRAMERRSTVLRSIARSRGAAAGGGTVYLRAGSYLCYSIHLKSKVALYLDQGATIVAADPAADSARSYDLAEPNKPWEDYQDYGHNHWHNSLIWGEGLHDVSIWGRD